MSETPIVLTNRSLPRTELDAVFRGNPRIRKAFEDLLADVGVTLPDAIGNASQDAASVLAQAAFLAPAQPFVAPSAPDASQALAQASFARPQPPAAPVNDAAGQILAGQIFGA